MRKVTVSFLLIFLAIFMFALPVQAATEAQIDAAIASGLAYLAGVQNPGPLPPGATDGSWGWSGGDWEAKTAAVLLKFETHAKEHGLDPFDNDPLSPTYYEYADNVIAGMYYLLSQAQVVTPLPIQTHGPNLDDPDSNSNGQGIAWLVGYDVYTTGLALSAISESCHPDDRSFVIGAVSYTYKQIAQDVADWLAYAQADFGPGEGGWAYIALDNDGDSPGGSITEEDNSNSGYAVLGLAYAIDFGCTVPEWVKDELNIWIDNIQDDVGVGPVTDDGGSWYRPPGPYEWSWVNILKTGNLIFEMALYGDDSSVTRVQDAVDYLERHWQDANNDPGWGYSLATANYQAMFTTMKGLEYMEIGELDTGDGVDEDWFNQEPTDAPSQDFASVIVAQQGTGTAPAAGAWPITMWDDPDGIMSTAWAMLTLQKAAPEPTPTPPVGGVWAPVNVLELMAPWIAVALIALAAVAAAGTRRFFMKHW